MAFHEILARWTDKNGVDPDNLVLNTTNATLIGMQKKYCTLDVCPMSWANISYLPNVGGNVFYLICFAVLLGAQLFYGIRAKTWTYAWPMVAGLLLEIIGYIGRLMLHSNPFILNNLLLYLVPLTIGPAFFTAAIYICLGRVIHVVGPEHSRISPKMYTYIFVGFDLLSLILQAAGGALAATAKDHAGSMQGADIMVGGLASQVVSMVFFMALWGDFILRARKAKLASFARSHELYPELRGTRSFALFRWSLVAATVLIFIRCVYRVAELKDGFSGELANDQTAFMILEGPMIILAVLAMTVCHPGRMLGHAWASIGRHHGMQPIKVDAETSATELAYQAPLGSDSDSEGQRLRIYGRK
ncbi:hypothetical protein INS49_006417 [Diaporthe citri]|uniref:uncharacterized protein n=1 Tax=Diaporthe citri TaxID=83186 RepID=UPI001C7FDB64|nr:uncharacterized protein INS49_006417 [Diaporthe citri]KAG6364813.1 hypothetical protein INS49_006417 [Diaporthe citri]